MHRYINKFQFFFLISAGLLQFVFAANPAFADVQKVTEGSGGEHSRFGWDVAVCGNYSLISAANESNEGGASAGAVYVYENIDGQWTNMQKLIAPDAGAYAYFGHALAMDSVHAVISAVGSFANGPFSGCAYVYRREGSLWIHQQTISPEDGAPTARFGQSVDISGDLILVGAHQAFGAAINSGCAYIFRSKDDLWKQEAKLVAEDGQKDDFFGWSVALNNAGAALVGAYSAKGKVDKSGAAYLFELQADGWTQTSKLIADDGQARDLFGYSLDLTNERALVGAYEHMNVEKFSGAAYLFFFDGSTWRQQHLLRHSQPDDHDFFGIEVCLNDSIAAVSASRDESDDDLDEGAVYLFKNENDVWLEVDILAADDGEAHDHYGLAVALSGPSVLVGARLNDNQSQDDGAAYFNSPGLLSGVQSSKIIPKKFALFQNYPNPFNPTTTINYDLPKSTWVNISVFDVLGRKVSTLVDKEQPAGHQSLVWSGLDFSGASAASGIYIYQIETEEFSASKSMLLLK